MLPKVDDMVFVAMGDSDDPQWELTGEVVSVDTETGLVYVRDGETGLVFGVDWEGADYAENLSR